MIRIKAAAKPNTPMRRIWRGDIIEITSIVTRAMAPNTPCRWT